MAKAAARAIRPWVRILAAGAALWLGWLWLAPAPSDRIVVGGELRERLRRDHLRRTGKLPTPEEEAALVDDYVGDEVLYREALRLGLDKGDVVIRRRLVQNMGFLLEDRDPVGAPSDDDLRRYLTENAARYARPATVSFTQVFVRAPRADGSDPAATAAALRRRLDAGADPGSLGDPFPRGARFAGLAAAEVEALFGDAFAARVAALPTGAWSQPLASPFGLHLVRVDARAPAATPELAAVRAQVAADWRRERRRAGERHALARLRARYTVVEEGGSPLAPARAQAAP